MYQTQKNQIRNLSKREFETLRSLCRLTKNLYNVGLYTVRQYWFNEQKHLRYESNYHYCKENENYKLLNTDIAQQTLKVVDRMFQSFYGLLKAIKSGFYTQKVRLPYYLPKDGYFPLLIPRIKVKEGKFRVPMSNAFKKEHGEIWIPFPTRLNVERIKEVRIHPKYGARFFEIEFITQAQPEVAVLNDQNAISIDLGLNNLVTCIDTNGASLIVDGKRLKSINQWYNKENARLQSIKDKQKIEKLTKKQAQLLLNRNNQVRDYLNKTARYIINYCINHQIGKLIVGYDLGIKQEINLGCRNNQNFVQLPFFSLRNKFNSLCERYGIKYKEQEESYTSKASFLDQDQIPVYNADAPKEYQFSGQRIKRGLYQTKLKHLVNSDLNGSANILVKSNHRFSFERVASGLLANPLRVRIS